MEGDVDRTDAPFLPPLSIMEEEPEYYTVEAFFAYWNLVAQIPKKLLPKNKEGILVAKAATSGQIMK
jgi:hypothetical protein